VAVVVKFVHNYKINNLILAEKLYQNDTKTLNTQNRQQNVKNKKTNIKRINLKNIEHLIRTERKYQ